MSFLNCNCTPLGTSSFTNCYENKSTADQCHNSKCILRRHQRHLLIYSPSNINRTKQEEQHLSMESSYHLQLSNRTLGRPYMLHPVELSSLHNNHGAIARGPTAAHTPSIITFNSSISIKQHPCPYNQIYAPHPEHAKVEVGKVHLNSSQTSILPQHRDHPYKRLITIRGQKEQIYLFFTFPIILRI